MDRTEIVDMLTELYSREDAEKRVVQVSPKSVEVNCDRYKENLKSRAHAMRDAQPDSKAVFAAHNVKYKEQEDGMLLVSLESHLQ